MIKYSLNKKEKSLLPSSLVANEPALLTIMNIEEFKDNYNQFTYYKELLHSLGSIRYCKVEVYKNCMLGTIRIPQKSTIQRKAQLTFGFYLTNQEIILIEDEGDLKSWLEKQIDLFHQIADPDQVLFQILEHMIDDDALYLLHVESEIEKMEEDISDKVKDDFFDQITKYRQKLSELNAYYLQLIDISDFFQLHICSLLTHHAEDWNKYSHRVNRLQNHVKLIREYILQLRELYQSKQEASKNKIMGILTIVTTFFMPLTLLTGWYGMNFYNMPEIKWQHGYLMVIILAMIIAIGEYIYFKKKKFF